MANKSKVIDITTNIDYEIIEMPGCAGIMGPASDPYKTIGTRIIVVTIKRAVDKAWKFEVRNYNNPSTSSLDRIYDLGL